MGADACPVPEGEDSVLKQMHRSVLFAVLVLVSVVVAQQCSQYQRCATCTATDGCGWCSATLQCLPGNDDGPNGQGSYCYSAWHYGAGSCTNCSSFSDCRQCRSWRSDCVWCADSSTCQQTGWTGCTLATTCPCNVYGDCSSCIDAGSDCGWCPTTGTCVKNNGPSNCTVTPLSSCPCSYQTNCFECNNDYTSNCQWCEATRTCYAKSNMSSCPIPHGGHSCSQYCAEQGTSCSTCNNIDGCGWCPESNSCVDVATSSCMLQHTCPNCPALGMCSSCLATTGCIWCSNSESCASLGSASCLIAQSCNAYCGLVSDCRSCQRRKGCAWCEDSNTCVDASTTSCFYAHTCTPSNAQCTGGFDAGSFVGGMFLVILIIALSVGVFLFYRWRVGKRVTYTELR